MGAAHEAHLLLRGEALRRFEGDGTAPWRMAPPRG
jgi:hypothetical protein